MTKLLALASLAVFAVACGGTPSTPELSLIHI